MYVYEPISCPSGHDPLHQLRVPGRARAVDEERGLHVVLAEQVQHARRPLRVGPAVEGERGGAGWHAGRLDPVVAEPEHRAPGVRRARDGPAARQLGARRVDLVRGPALEGEGGDDHGEDEQQQRPVPARGAAYRVPAHLSAPPRGAPASALEDGAGRGLSTTGRPGRGPCCPATGRPVCGLGFPAAGRGPLVLGGCDPTGCHSPPTSTPTSIRYPAHAHPTVTARTRDSLLRQPELSMNTGRCRGAARRAGCVMGRPRRAGTLGPAPSMPASAATCGSACPYAFGSASPYACACPIGRKSSTPGLSDICGVPRTQYS